MQQAYDELWPGTRFVRSGHGFPLGTDAVLLADFCVRGQVKRFADLGCGAGVILILLAQAYPTARGFGIELTAKYFVALCFVHSGICGTIDNTVYLFFLYHAVDGFLVGDVQLSHISIYEVMLSVKFLQ